MPGGLFLAYQTKPIFWSHAPEIGGRRDRALGATAAAVGCGAAGRAARAPHRADRKGFRVAARPGQRGEPGRRPVAAGRGGPGLPAADPAGERAGEQPRGDGRLLRAGRGGAGPARQDGHVPRARRAAAGPRRLGHHGGQHRPAAGIPGVRLFPAAAGQRAHRRHGHRLAGRRAGRRPRLRGVLLRRQPGRRGYPQCPAEPVSGGARAAGPGGDRPRQAGGPAAAPTSRRSRWPRRRRPAAR